MKLTLFLAASLALNAAAAVLILLGRDARPPPSAPAVSRPAAPAAVQPPEIDAGVWPALENADRRGQIARLQESGFPPEIVRAVLAAQIGEQFAARRKALQAGEADRPFWKDTMSDPKTRLAQHELGMEQRKLMRELFGEAADGDDPFRNVYQNRTLGFLPAEKAAQVRQVTRDFDERRGALFASGLDFTTDRGKITALEKEQETAIAQLLTPDELQEYNVRNSRAAQSLREQLSAFNPTEEEFRFMFRLRQPYEERYEPYTTPRLTMEELRERVDAEKRLNEQIKAALAPERAAEYDRAIDSNYRRASQLIARLELPPETAPQLYTVQKDIEQRRGDLYRSSSSANRTQQLAELQKEALARVTPLLGSAQNVEAYKQYGGSWIDSLIPRPRPSPAPK